MESKTQKENEKKKAPLSAGLIDLVQTRAESDCGLLNCVFTNRLCEFTDISKNKSLRSITQVDVYNVETLAPSPAEHENGY